MPFNSTSHIPSGNRGHDNSFRYRPHFAGTQILVPEAIPKAQQQHYVTGLHDATVLQSSKMKSGHVLGSIACAHLLHRPFNSESTVHGMSTSLLHRTPNAKLTPRTIKRRARQLGNSGDGTPLLYSEVSEEKIFTLQEDRRER